MSIEALKPQRVLKILENGSPEVQKINDLCVSPTAQCYQFVIIIEFSCSMEDIKKTNFVQSYSVLLVHSVGLHYFCLRMLTFQSSNHFCTVFIFYWTGIIYTVYFITEVVCV